MKLLSLVLTLFLCGSVHAQSYLEIENQNVNAPATITAGRSIVVRPNSQVSASSGQSSHMYIDLSSPIGGPLSGSTGTYLDYTSFDFNEPIDLQYAVGTIPGSFNVSSSGDATYNVPIEVPLGQNGFAPRINLSYTSSGSNGPIGLGWSLGGYSVITRFPSNYDYDAGYYGGTNYVDHVDFDVHDRFALDGNRMVKSSGTFTSNMPYYEPGATYRTINETWINIQASSTSIGNGPSEFTAITKDGRTLRYGKSGDSRLDFGGEVYAWYLTEEEDIYGNIIKYEYVKNATNHTLRISKISYAFNQATSRPGVEVIFDYSERQDDQIYFQSGHEVKLDFLLSGIRIYQNSNLTLKYELNYLFDKVSKLSRLTQKNSNGEQLNSTLFNWPKLVEITSALASSQFVTTQSFTGNLMPTDINADGYTDFISYTYTKEEAGSCWEYTTEYIHHTHKYSVKAYINAGDGSNVFQSITIKPTFVSRRRLNSGNCVYDYYGAFNLEIGDFNGDLKQEVLIQRFNGNHVFEIYEYNELNMSFDLVDNKIHVMNGQTSSVQVIPGLEVGDVNGDGIDDVVYDYYSPNGSTNAWYAYFGSHLSASYIDLTSTAFSFGLDNSIVNFDMVDFNRDGKDEIFHLAGNGNYRLYTMEYSSVNGREILQTQAGTLNDFDWYGYGDFNGDGLLDIILQDDNLITTYGFDGIDFTALPQYNRVLPTHPYDHESFVVTDLHGDGFSDLVHVVFGQNVIGGYQYDGEINILANNTATNGFDAPYSLSNHKVFSINQDYRRIALPVDFDGDGIQEIFLDKVGADEYFSIYSGTSFKRMSAIRDGFGRVTNISYQRLNEGLAYTYELDGSESYPKTPFLGPIHVVNQVQQPGNHITNFTYQNLLYNVRESSVIGYEGVVAHDLMTDIRTTMNSQTLGYWAPYLVPSSNVKEHVSSGVLLQTVTTTSELGSNQFSNGRFTRNARTIRTIITDHLNESKTERNMSYDQMGNVDISDVKYYDELGGVSTLVKTITVDNTHVNQNSWLSNVLEEVTTTIEVSNEPNVTRTSNYYYDSFGRLSKLVADEGTSKEVSILYENYDDYGNIQREITSSPGLSNRIILRNFSEDGLHLESLTVNQEMVSFNEYDSEYGYIVSTTDENGQKAHFTYDLWGRRYKTEYSDGHTIWNQIGWADPITDPVDALTVIHTWSSDGNEAYDYQNALGLNVESSVKGVGGQFLTSKREYYPNGSLFRESTPMASGATAQWVTYTYDDLGRISSESGPGTDISYSYNGRNVSLIDNLSGEVITKVNDALGNLVSSTDPGGTVSYAYNSRNQLIEATGLLGVTTFEYDLHGNRTEINDPDGGIVQHSYNAFGELISRIDAKGQSTTLSYDINGRLETETGSAYTIQMSYDPQNRKGSIDEMSMTSSAGTVSYDYDYNSEGLLSTKAVDINGDTWTTNYTYTTEGEPLTKQYPSQFEVEYVYDSNNDLYQILGRKSGQTFTVWTRGSVDEQGRVTDFLLGNGLVETYVFNQDLGTVNEWTVGNIVDFTYDWNSQTGNLSQKDDNVNSQSESYVYDNLNRLVEWTTTGASTSSASISYGSDGNILEKSDFGYYDYSLPQPHAVGMIETPRQDIIAQIVEYTEYNKVEYVQEGEYEAFYTYGPDKQRVQTQVLNRGEPLYIRTYIDGEYQEEFRPSTETTISYSFVYVQTRPVAVWVEENGAGELFYLHTDYQGSIYAISDVYGAVVEYLSYDPWGNRRNAHDWSSSTLNGWMAPQSLLFRGFTFHEHMDEFGFINMNGRIYDPAIGRFYSPDPFVQSPGRTQGYNRFAYAFNNPLRYTDPSGEVVVEAILIGAAYGAIAGGTAYAVSTLVTNQAWDWEKFGVSVLGGALTGAVAGWVSPTSISIPFSKGFGNAIAQGALGVFPWPSYELELSDSWSINLSLAVAAGRSSGIGLNSSISYSDDNPGSNNDFKFAVGYGFTYYGNQPGSGASGFEQRFSGAVGVVGRDAGILLTTNYFYHGSGSQFNQQVGGVTLNSRVGDAPVSVTYENDGWPFLKQGLKYPLGYLADGGDRYRTAALSVKVDKFGIGFNLYTGDPGLDEDTRSLNVSETSEYYPRGYYEGNSDDFRLGAVYTIVGNARLGTDSEAHRHAIQNKFAHSGPYGNPQPYFKVLDLPTTTYFQYLNNPFTLW